MNQQCAFSAEKDVGILILSCLVIEKSINGTSSEMILLHLLSTAEKTPGVLCHVQGSPVQERS